MTHKRNVRILTAVLVVLLLIIAALTAHLASAETTRDIEPVPVLVIEPEANQHVIVLCRKGTDKLLEWTGIWNGRRKHTVVCYDFPEITPTPPSSGTVPDDNGK